MRRLSNKAIATALKASQGNVSAAARALSSTRMTLHRRIQASYELQEILSDARESMLDNAESALSRAVLNMEAWAICFLLKTQGKSRGYVERSEIKTESKVALVNNPEELTDHELTIIATGGSIASIKKEASQKDSD